MRRGLKNSLILLFFPLLAYGQDIGPSLVIDSGFETGLNSWIAWNNASTLNTVSPLAGTQSLRFSTAPGGRGQLITNIQAGARYRLTGLGRLTNLNDLATIGVSFANSTGQMIVDQWIKVESTTPRLYSFDLQAPAGATEVYVYAFKNSGDQPADFDNLNLVKIADQ